MDFHTDYIYGFPDVYQDYHFFHKMKLEDSDKVDFSWTPLVITSIFFVGVNELMICS